MEKKSEVDIYASLQKTLGKLAGEEEKGSAEGNKESKPVPKILHKTVDKVMQSFEKTKKEKEAVKTLSFVWFALCTSLVTKHHDMVAVFYSFVGSFLSAKLLAVIMGRNKKWKKSMFGMNEDGSNSNSNSERKTIGKKDTLENLMTKSQVGILVSSLSLLLLLLPATYLQSIQTFIHIHKSPEFHALANVAGYLAFALWYDFMCCRRVQGSGPVTRSIVEDVATLSALCVILTKWDALDMSIIKIGSSSLSSSSSSSSSTTCFCIVAWLGYKIWGLSMEILDQRTEHKELMEPSTAAGIAVAVAISRENLWTVHGKDYDLKDFVQSHPGGREAILLGMGRDCTALFESYHPFTDRHRTVLKKYMQNMDGSKEQNEKVSKADANATHEEYVGGVRKKDADSDTDTDEFYNVLKDRVAKTLHKHGIDPTKDRAATTGRSLYYILILMLLITSGSYHIQGNPMGSFFFALFGWLIGSLGHDAGHFAASRIPFVNDLGVWGMSFLCNPIMWQHQHTFAHHSHTNDFDQDPDLHHFIYMLKVHRRFQHDPIYKQQKNLWYVITAYALVVFGECIKIPIGMMKTGFLYDMVEFTDQKRPMRHLGMYVHYFGYLALIVAAPFFSASSYSKAIACAVIHIVTAGWLFAVFSQINHLNEFSIETDRGESNFTSNSITVLLNSESR